MRRITVAIHTYEKALGLRTLLEGENIDVTLENVNLEIPGFSSGVRVRINESDLPHALRIIENRELFQPVPGADSHIILVPVDLSERSYKAAKVAIDIAAKQKAQVVLLYSFLDPYIAGNLQFTDSLSYEIGESGARQQIQDNATKLLKHFSDRIKAEIKSGELPLVRISTEVVEGVPEDSIVEYAKFHLPRLIVMGTRAAGTKEREIIGSVTAEVLDEGRFSVLTVPESTPMEYSLTPKNILFFSNLDQNDILAIDGLYRLYGGESASVTIVHIPRKHRFSDGAADKALRRLGDYCSKNFNHYHFISVPVSHTDGDKEFAELQQTHNFDLVVVPNRRRNAFSRLFNPGLAHKILFQTDIPMLVIPV